MKKISIITPVYNEEDNIIPLSHEIHEVLKFIPCYECEHIYIDNSSTDGTVDKIKEVIKTYVAEVTEMSENMKK